MYEYRCEILNVVDGDTVDLKIDLGFSINYNMRVRLAHINTPEMNTPEGVKAKNYLISKINELLKTDDCFICRTEKDRKDKYGRYLATIVHNFSTTNLNNYMLENKLAVPYM